MSSSRNRAVQQAVQRFKLSVFEDPVSLQVVGRSRGIVLNKQMYNARSINKARTRGYPLVPHSRRALTNTEIKMAHIVARGLNNKYSKNISAGTRDLVQPLTAGIVQSLHLDEHLPQFGWRHGIKTVRIAAVAFRMVSREDMIVELEDGTLVARITGGTWNNDVVAKVSRVTALRDVVNTVVKPAIRIAADILTAETLVPTRLRFA